MIATLLALALGPAPVYVEANPGVDDQQTRSLRDQLMLRLLEEGYPLAPSADHATRTLRIDTTPDGIRVEAEGEDLHAFEVATGPVLPLEAVHRAMQALDEVTPRAEPTVPPARRFAVHVQDAPANTSPEAVRRVLVNELLARNGAVVPLDEDPDAVVCAESLGDQIALSSGADVGGCGLQPTAVSLQQAQLDPVQLDRSIDAIMQPPAAIDVSSTEIEPPVVTRPSTGLAVDRPPPPPSPKVAVRVGARAGVYGRIKAADPAVGASVRVGREAGPGGVVDVLLMPASAPDISILETLLTGGFGWTWAVHPVVSLHAHALGGLAVHRSRQRGDDRANNRLDWTAEVPLGTSLRLSRGLRLDLTLRGGVSGRPREHRVDDQPVWERSQWRVGAAVGLSYGWGGHRE